MRILCYFIEETYRCPKSEPTKGEKRAHLKK